MKAVILAAGIGSRLKPIIGSDKSKTMLEYGDQPLLRRTIDALSSRDVKEIVMVVGHLKEKLMGYFGDGSKFGVKIDYVVQENPKGGTADALKQAKEKIKDEKFIVIYGDNIFDYAILDEVLKKENGFDGLLCCKEVDNPQIFGTLEVADGLVKKITEKSPNPPSNLALTGIFILPNEIFSAIDETKISPRGELELTESIQILINRGRKISYIVAKSYWIDPSTKEELVRAQQLVTK